MYFLFLVVALLQAITLSWGITCNSLGRACISSTEYQTCISVDGEFIATNGLVITCPSGQVCSEDSTYPCVDGPVASSNPSVCGPLGRSCISSNEYITCISVDGEYIATTGQVITCPSGQVCKEDTTYPCNDDPGAASASPNCGPLGRRCLSQTEYITCILVDGEYIATTGQVITCPSGDVCREDTTYPCVDGTDTSAGSSVVSCGSMGRACISQTDYATCISVDGTYVAMTDQIITCPSGQVCNQDTTYPCVDQAVAPLVAAVPLAVATCSASGIACISSNEYVTCVEVDGAYIVSTGMTITCADGLVCSANGKYPCIDDPNPSSSSSLSVSTTSTTLASATTTAGPICTADDTTHPGPQCNQYYHCYLVLWWYSLEVLTCPQGQAYDQISGQCVASTTCIV